MSEGMFSDVVLLIFSGWALNQKVAVERNNWLVMR